MTLKLHKPYFIIEQDEPLTYSAAIAAGHVTACSHRSPDKDTVNEDAAAFIPLNDQRCIFVVADGAGGSRGGAQAASIAVKTLAKVTADAFAKNEDTLNAIMTAIDSANNRILQLGIGAYTTLVVVEVINDTVRTYHIGDSEVLICGSHGKIKHQTISHSPVGYAVEAGLIDETEALHHEERHIVSNMLGSEETHITVSTQIKLAKYDTLLIASDGLFDNLHRDEIVTLMRKGELHTAAENLFNQASERMVNPGREFPSKPDDLTLLLYKNF